MTMRANPINLNKANLVNSDFQLKQKTHLTPTSRVGVVVVTSFIVLIVVILLGTQLSNCSVAERQKQYNEANKLWPSEAIRVSCTAIDTDGNGYISCAVTHNGSTEAFECPTLFQSRWNKVCRLLKLDLQRRQ